MAFLRQSQQYRVKLENCPTTFKLLITNREGKKMKFTKIPR